jgi:hypothetical protein
MFTYERENRTFNYYYIESNRRWVDNIKMDLREIGWDGADLDGRRFRF